MSDLRHVLGIDIGGTKLAVGVVGSDGRLVCAERLPTEAAQGPGAIVGRLIDLCKGVAERSGVPLEQIAGAGIGCPGLIDSKQGLVELPGNLPGWDRVPLAQRVSEALGIPAFLENDANAAALGEHRFGAGRGAADMLYLTISTGIGGGIIANNQLYTGATGGAGEIGHMTLRYDGRPCVCGSIGCFEAYASGTALAARAREAVRDDPSARSMLARPETITAQRVVEAVRAGDSLALGVWEETMVALGAGLASLIHIFNPRRIVIGGGLSNAGDLLFDPLRRHTAARALRPLADACEIVPAQLGEHAGVLGAGAVAFERIV
jgi:glucokinase